MSKKQHSGNNVLAIPAGLRVAGPIYCKNSFIEMKIKDITVLSVLILQVFSDTENFLLLGLKKDRN